MRRDEEVDDALVELAIENMALAVDDAARNRDS
jgi:hypothetical protein